MKIMVNITESIENFRVVTDLNELNSQNLPWIKQVVSGQNTHRKYIQHNNI